MSRLPRGDRLLARARPKRRAAAKANIFKYQLAIDPSRVEENDLKRALQESLEESDIKNTSNNVIKPPNSKKARLCTTNNSSNADVAIIATIPRKNGINSNGKRNLKSPVGTNNNNTSNGHQQHNNKNKNRCDVNQNNSLLTKLDMSPPSSVTRTPNRVIRTYSRNNINNNNNNNNNNNVNDNIDSQQKTNNKSQISATTTHKYLTPSSSQSSSSAIICKPKPMNITSTDYKATTNGHGPKTKSLTNQSSVSRSTQTPMCKANVNNNKNNHVNSAKSSSTPSSSSSPSSSNVTPNATPNKTNSLKNKNPPPVTKDNGTIVTTNGTDPPVQTNQYLKAKRESKNYAYVKMTALKVSTEKFPSSQSRNSTPKKTSPKGILNNSSANKDSLKATQKKARDNNSNDNHTSLNVSSNSSKRNTDTTVTLLLNGEKEVGKSSLKHDTIVKNNVKQIKGVKSTASPSKVQQLDESGIEYDCSPVEINVDLSNDGDQSQSSVNVSQKRNPEGSWSLLGVPEEKVIYLRDDEPPRRLICYPAIKHVEGDVIQVRDSVLLRSGARKTDLPYIAKVCAFWEDAETGGVMMSLFWYYRPEHIEDGRRPHHLMDEIFASRHRDVDTVECIEDKCYVLTFNEYCRYRKRCKMEQVNTTWSLTDVTIPMSNESYPRRNRIPDSDVNPELVFCCRQVYDSRLKRLLKNPLIDPKYGHI